MDYEKYKNEKEKARLRYNEIKDTDCSEKEFLLDLFPELSESEDEKIRKALVRFHKSTIDVDGIKGEEIVAWLEKQSGCFAIWKKNTTDNKPTLNHSVLMKSIHGIAEGEWNGKEWIQYKWSCKVKDSDVLYWMNLYELEKQGEQKSPWSEDDERIVTALMEGFRYHQLFNPKFGEVPNAEIISWIKSLKERLS